MQSPETRHSLILRLQNREDVQSWNEFVELYEPLVYRLACRLGLQHADAMEAKQEVMLHLTEVVSGWKPVEGGSFRGWLYRVARNVMVRQLEQRKIGAQGSGDSREQRLLMEWAAPGEERSRAFDTQFQRQVFAWAANRVRQQVDRTTWEAFWASFVLRKSIADVASELKLSKGKVYVARSRVMKKLRETVQKQWHLDWADIRSTRTQRVIEAFTHASSLRLRKTRATVGP